MVEQNKTVYREILGEGIRTIVLNQPEKRNAISADMMDMLRDYLIEADSDDETRVLILKGAGDTFSSGGDLSQNTGAIRPEDNRRMLRHYIRTVQAVRQVSKPIIAQVDGYAVGGAFALVLACDLICASERAFFVPAFCQVGIIPEMGMMKFLPELVGLQKAKEILFFGGSYSAAQLQDMGLLNRVFPDAALETETLAFAQRLAEMPETSIQITKGIMNSIADSNLHAVLEAEATASPFCTTTQAYTSMKESFRGER